MGDLDLLAPLCAITLPQFDLSQCDSAAADTASSTLLKMPYSPSGMLGRWESPADSCLAADPDEPAPCERAAPFPPSRRITSDTTSSTIA